MVNLPTNKSFRSCKRSESPTTIKRPLDLTTQHSVTLKSSNGSSSFGKRTTVNRGEPNNYVVFYISTVPSGTERMNISQRQWSLTSGDNAERDNRSGVHVHFDYHLAKITYQLQMGLTFGKFSSRGLSVWNVSSQRWECPIEDDIRSKAN
ncbi:hypothetical protein J6590_026327 [Homalodisca vitripennis]|nr:hypothetical protein J6590_026327 [Homalodisca vitripennis]